jgi:phosphotransferase system HPr-like phosphotransfer protein
MNIMEKYQLTFRSMEQILNFVNWGERVENTMDITKGSLAVDAKSLMGILAIGLDREVTLSVHGRLAEEDKRFLVEYHLKPLPDDVQA